MTENWRGVQRVVKRGIAGTIFVLLLLGGSAAVFSALAAGVNALTAVDESSTPSTAYNGNGSYSAPVSPLSPAQSPAVSYANPISPGNPSNAQMDFTDRLNYALEHMHSPVSGAIDTGGVVLGDRLSHSFGGFMSNLLQFLFVEQADSSGSAGSTGGPRG